MTLSLSSPRFTLTGTAAALVGLAVAFNLPFAYLGAAFDYPNILRKPPAEILQAFTAGGPMLVLAWYGFALAALAFIPVGLAHALAKDRLRTAPALAISAAILGALAGLTQAMGLLRWVMVVPGLAQSGDAQGFMLLHAYAGVAVGEHLGMLLTAAHVTVISLMQGREGARKTTVLGLGIAVLIGLGAFEGLAMALQLDGKALGLMAMTGYIALTAWLVASAVWVARGCPLPQTNISEVPPRTGIILPVNTSRALYTIQRSLCPAHDCTDCPARFPEKHAASATGRQGQGQLCLGYVRQAVHRRIGRARGLLHRPCQ